MNRTSATLAGLALASVVTGVGMFSLAAGLIANGLALGALAWLTMDVGADR